MTTGTSYIFATTNGLKIEAKLYDAHDNLVALTDQQWNTLQPDIEALSKKYQSEYLNSRRVTVLEGSGTPQIQVAESAARIEGIAAQVWPHIALLIRPADDGFIDLDAPPPSDDDPMFAESRPARDSDADTGAGVGRSRPAAAAVAAPPADSDGDSPTEVRRRRAAAATPSGALPGPAGARLTTGRLADDPGAKARLAGWMSEVVDRANASS